MSGPVRAFPGARSRARRAASASPAFTLVELLVVIGIIAILITLLMPALGKIRDQANGAKCMNNQRQLMMAFLMFAADNKGHLPGQFTDYANSDTNKRAWLLNHMAPLTDAPRNGTLYKYVKTDEVYRCPSLDNDNVRNATNSNGQFDYASFAVFTGAKVSNIKPESKHVFVDGRVEYLPTPIICEEDARAINGANIEGFHNASDRIANTHPNARWKTVGSEKVAMGGGYYASIDGSVHYFKEPRGSRGGYDWSQRGPRGREVSFGEAGFHIVFGWWDAQ